jgi:hypothetical protein
MRLSRIDYGPSPTSLLAKAELVSCSLHTKNRTAPIQLHAKLIVVFMFHEAESTKDQESILMIEDFFGNENLVKLVQAQLLTQGIRFRAEPRPRYSSRVSASRFAV